MLDSRGSKEIKIYFTDFWASFDPHNNFLTDILKQKFSVVLEEKNPDFLFHSCFGHRYKKFNCVKICFLGENLTPDFNLSDYACGFDFIDFEDRYFRMPLYRLYMGNEAFCVYDKEFFLNEIAKKDKFCNFIYSNDRNSSCQRELFFKELSQYKKVDSGGKFLNNIGYRVDDKIAWQRSYKFSIAFENSCKNGYSTEKIYDGLRAHTVPIYWGNPRVTDDFNPKRFISCHDFGSFKEVIEYVKYLDTHPDRYLEMLSQPWFVGNVSPRPHDDASFVQFLEQAIQQGPEKARRTTRDGASAAYYYEQVYLGKIAPVCSLISRGRNVWCRLTRAARRAWT
jgi:hypothetical protein